MKRHIATFLAGVFMALASNHLPTPAAPGEWEPNSYYPPACNVNPCVIKYDSGGYIDEYAALASRLLATGWRVELHGECYSACTVLMDRVRPNACITQDAELAIHQGSIQIRPSVFHRFDIPYSADIGKWIEKHGGQPDDGWLIMSFEDATAFWPVCPSKIDATPLPQLRKDQP